MPVNITSSTDIPLKQGLERIPSLSYDQYKCSTDIPLKQGLELCQQP